LVWCGREARGNSPGLREIGSFAAHSVLVGVDRNCAPSPITREPPPVFHGRRCSLPPVERASRPPAISPSNHRLWPDRGATPAHAIYAGLPDRLTVRSTPMELRFVTGTAVAWTKSSCTHQKDWVIPYLEGNVRRTMLLGGWLGELLRDAHPLKHRASVPWAPTCRLGEPRSSRVWDNDNRKGCGRAGQRTGELGAQIQQNNPTLRGTHTPFPVGSC